MTPAEWSGTLRVAGLRIQLHCRGVAPARLEGRYGNFVSNADDRDPDVRVDAVVAESFRSVEQPDGIEYPACLGRLSHDGSIAYQRRAMRMRFEPATHTATVFAAPTSPELSREDDPTPIDAPLRLLVSYLLAEREGLLLHASGYGDDRGAVIFAGESGAGKTTTARKIDHEHVLSDDQIAIRRIDGRWFAYSLPFVGEYRMQPLPRVCPLARILLLEKSRTETEVHAIHPALATARLLACVPWFVPDSPLAAELLPLAIDAARAGRVARTAIARDGPIRGMIEELLSCPPPSR